MLTVLLCWLLCGFLAGQAIKPSLRADRVFVLKKERKLELMNSGKVIKTYEVALGGDPIGAKTRQGDHKTPEGVYLLDRATRTASFTNRFTFPIPMCRTGRQRERTEFLRAETCSFTICPTDIDMSVWLIGLRIGPMDASRSRTKS